MRTIEERNKMIAEFMGYETYEHTGSIAIRITKGNEFNSVDFGHVHTKFHTSWDWLMPVVIYINVNTEHTFVIQAMDCYVYNVNNGEQVTQPSMKHQPSELINSVYETVIEFIEMYNQKN